MRMNFKRIAIKRLVASCAILLFLNACQFVDYSVEPRTYQVNLGTQNVREELILLNLVRASRFEPLNFTALSKYTASGTLGGSAGAVNNMGIDFEPYRGGPTAPALLGNNPQTIANVSGNVSTGNSFDLVPLDTQDFYANFLGTLTPEKIYLLVNAGLSREIVFHSLLKSIDVNLSGEGKALTKGYSKLRFNNDPSNDTWNREIGPAAFETCKIEAERDKEHSSTINNGRWAPFYTEFWLKEHITDCSYHKFLLLLHAAFEYGVTTAAVQKDSKSQSARLNQINVNVSTTGQGEKSDQKAVVLCFDTALAAYYKRVLHGRSQCGDKEIKGPLQTQLGRFDASVEPVLHSAYAVFQYYGQLLRSNIKVGLTPLAQRKTNDPLLFTVTSDLTGCFAHVDYAGKSYCVPNENSGNTKEVLTLLIALVNLSTSRSSLPVTPTVLVNQ